MAIMIDDPGGEGGGGGGGTTTITTSGTTTPTLTLSTVPASLNGYFFRLRVSNLYGVVTSNAVTATVTSVASAAYTWQIDPYNVVGGNRLTQDSNGAVISTDSSLESATTITVNGTIYTRGVLTQNSSSVSGGISWNYQRYSATAGTVAAPPPSTPTPPPAPPPSSSAIPWVIVTPSPNLIAGAAGTIEITAISPTAAASSFPVNERNWTISANPSNVVSFSNSTGTVVQLGEGEVDWFSSITATAVTAGTTTLTLTNSTGTVATTTMTVGASAVPPPPPAAPPPADPPPPPADGGGGGGGGGGLDMNEV